MNKNFTNQWEKYYLLEKQGTITTLKFAKPSSLIAL
jgi:hypothetical protein